jgi:hypothetical protein
LVRKVQKVAILAEPWAEAVAVRAERFLVVGSNADVKAVTVEATEIVDPDGRFDMPVFSTCTRTTAFNNMLNLDPKPSVPLRRPSCAFKPLAGCG